MSLSKFKLFMHARKEEKKEKEMEEYRHNLKILMREKKRMKQQQATDNIKNSARGISSLIGRAVPKNKLEIKSNRPSIRR
jgi:hypothetical protein